MELMALDKDFKLLGYLPFLNLQWNRRYYEAGEFSAQIRKQDYMPEAAYLFSKDRPEVGLVQKIETDRNVKGEFVMISGHFAEKLADRNIFYPKFTMNATPYAISKKAMRDYAPDGFLIDVVESKKDASVIWSQGSISSTTGNELEFDTRCRTGFIAVGRGQTLYVEPNGLQYSVVSYSTDKAYNGALIAAWATGSGSCTPDEDSLLRVVCSKIDGSSISPSEVTVSVLISDDKGEKTSVEWLGQEVSTSLYDMLKTQEMSQSVYFDFDTDKLKYKVWQGLDRTQSQSVNPWALFTDDSSAVSQFKVTENESEYKNFAVVLYGDRESPSMLDVDVRKDSAETKRKLFMEHYGTDQDVEELKQEAKEQLQEYALVRNVEVKASQKDLVYLVDYDLGDKCDVIDHQMKKSYETRIIGVDEVFKANQHIVDIVFGEKIPTTYNKLNRLVRNMRR